MSQFKSLSDYWYLFLVIYLCHCDKKAIKSIKHRHRCVLCNMSYENNFEGLSEYTLSSKSLSPLSSVCFKTTQTTGGVGVAGACPPTSKLETFL